MRDRDTKRRQASGDRNGARLHPERLFRGPRPSKEHYLRGESHSSAKLDDGKVRQIIRLRTTGQSAQKIADQFGVRKFVVQQILANKAWTHVSRDV